MNVMLLCKVVDNYGDIGFVYRLARALSKIAPDFKLSLVVSNLNSFAKMAPDIDASLAVQEIYGWTVLDWNAQDECISFCSKTSPDVILECFQCSRPAWLERLLFESDFSKTVHIVNVEYLTAESWADDFHLLKSATRKPSVKKINFMPGFTPKTGGLILNDVCKDDFSVPQISFPAAQEASNFFTVLVFSYERNFDAEVKALVEFESFMRKKNPLFKIRIFAAQGLSLLPLIDSVKKNNADFEFVELPYLSQMQWDALLQKTDFNFVRGEDSFARACLSSVPFVWHVYRQENEFQLVKLDAFLERLKPFFSKELYELFYAYLVMYNFDGKILEPLDAAPEALCVLQKISCGPYAGSERGELLLKILLHAEELKKSFACFAESLEQNGNLAEHLADLIRSFGQE